jgi:hypothetical protein
VRREAVSAFSLKERAVEEKATVIEDMEQVYQHYVKLHCSIDAKVQTLVDEDGNSSFVVGALATLKKRILAVESRLFIMRDLFSGYVSMQPVMKYHSMFEILTVTRSMFSESDIMAAEEVDCSISSCSSVDEVDELVD